MSYPFPTDVQQLIASQMATGRYTNEDELLRDALQVLQEFDRDAAAIQLAVDDWQAGDEGQPLNEAFDAIRARAQRKPSV
jgi:Arc/MetJ-type ribon-helix-helix transcriptional regulator